MWVKGGGGLGNRISCLKNLPKAKIKGGGFKEVFRCAGVSSAGRAPRPPKSAPPTTRHQMKYIVLGTSEQLGMRPCCDLTIRTAPTNVYGGVSSAWVFPVTDSPFSRAARHSSPR